VVTTAILASVGHSEAHRLVLWSSTNVANLAHGRFGTMALSALWFAQPSAVVQLVPFVFVHGIAERWLGTLRWLAVWLVGHVGATIVALSWIVLVKGRMLALSHAPDVGVSYGLLATAAVVAMRVPRRWRPWYLIGLFGYLAYDLLYRPDFTAFGHAAAVGIGLVVALGAACARRARRARAAVAVAG
jgi:hypothetical protein